MYDDVALRTMTRAEILTAHTVLITAIDALDDSVQRSTALKLIEEWYALDKRATVEELTIRGAHEKILGRPITAAMFEPVKKPTDRRMFEMTTRAWLAWASGGDPTHLLKAIPQPSEYGGAIHMMALEPWGGAINALHRRDLVDALRLFRRSIELGTQCGTPTNDVVRWTYVASFFHEDHRGT